jgi:choline-phosphate cytidylyltransferase
MQALEQCKKAYPNTYLIVGCCSDEKTLKFKGKTVMNESERYESLRHCKWVDEVVEDAPWVLTKEFLDLHKIDFVCHDAIPYADTTGGGAGDIYGEIKKMGKFHETQRTEGISTTDLINRIIKDYDAYVRRNLSRGISGKEMNIPFIKEKLIQADLVVDKVKSDVSHVIKKWDESADHLFDGFLGLFSR